MDRANSYSSSWLWLSVLTSFAIFALSSGKILLASGFLLLGAFAFFNNPLAPTPARVANPTILVGLSWACGALGVIAVLAAATRTLL